MTDTPLSTYQIDIKRLLESREREETYLIMRPDGSAYLVGVSDAALLDHYNTTVILHVQVFLRADDCDKDWNPSSTLETSRVKMPPLSMNVICLTESGAREVLPVFFNRRDHVYSLSARDNADGVIIAETDVTAIAAEWRDKHERIAAKKQSMQDTLLKRAIGDTDTLYLLVMDRARHSWLMNFSCIERSATSSIKTMKEWFGIRRAPVHVLDFKLPNNRPVHTVIIPVVEEEVLHELVELFRDAEAAGQMQVLKEVIGPISNLPLQGLYETHIKQRASRKHRA